MTGACIESCNIDATTDLRGVKDSRKRRPADPERTFEPGGFEKLYAKVLEQMEILLKKGLSSAAMREAFQELQTQFLLATAQNKLLAAHNQDLKELALAAAAAGVSVQLGDKKVEDRSIHVRGSLSGDVSRLTQTLNQTGGESAGLATAIEKLAAAITESKAITAPEKHEATQQVITVAEAGKDAKDPGWQAAAGKALERLTALLGKAPELAKLVEVTEKAWEAVSKGMGH